MAGRTQAPGESPLRFRLKPFFVREVELLIARPLQLIWHTKAIVLPLARRPLIVMAALKLRQEHFVIDRAFETLKMSITAFARKRR